MKKLILPLIAGLIIGLTGILTYTNVTQPAIGGVGTIYQLSQWAVDSSNRITQNVSGAVLKLTGLESSGDCLVTDAAGVVSTSTCGGAGGHTIEDEGTPLTDRTNMNFVGAGVTATDAGGKTVVTIPGGGVAIGDTVTSATAGSVLFAGAAGVLAQKNAQLFWDDTNNRLGIGTTSPSQKLDVVGSISIPTTISSTTGVIYKGVNRFIHNFAKAGSDGSNTFVGVNAGNFTMGTGAGASWEGSYNTADGANALQNNTKGYNNSAQGANALGSNTTGYNNSAQGANALQNNTTGTYNSAQGGSALLFNTTGSNNSAQGYAALYNNTTGAFNSAQGVYALYSNTTGYNNSAQGVYTLFYNTTGYDNSAQGANALYSNTTGYGNSAQGPYSLQNTTEGNHNSAQGYASLQENITGSNNSAQGYYAGGSIDTGNNNTFIGYRTGYHASQLTSALNSMALGNGAYTTASDQVIIGNASVNVGLAQTIPTARLHLPAGKAAANTAPLKFTSGVLNTTPEAGAVEFLTDAFYGTITTGGARKQFAFTDLAQTFTGIQTFSTPIAATSIATMSSTVGGAVPTPPNNTTTFLRGDGTFAAPSSGFADPLTTNGDIIARISGNTTRLAQGANGTFLGVSGGALGYFTPASGGDMILASAQTNTGAKTFLDTTFLLRNVANTFNGSFVNTNTANRVYTLKDANGTLAFTSDITGTNSGTNTGDQTITLTGGVTGSGVGSFAATVVTNANLTGPVTSTGNATAIANSAITNAMLANGAVANLSGTNSGDQTTVSGNAGSATVLQTARTIAGQSFNGSANISIAATNLSDSALLARLASPTFTGTVVLPSGQALIAPALGTPASGVMTNVTGTAAGLTAGNVTTNANLTGVVTSTGNSTAIANSAITNAMLANGAVANLTGTNSGDNSTNSLYSGLVSNANHTGDATGSTALTVVRLNGTSLAGLATGLLRNTTGTGVPNIAINSDLPVMSATVGGAVPTPPNNTTTFLRGDGTFAAPSSGFADPLTTNGDIIARISGNTTRLAQGANGTFLGVSGGALGYFTPAGGGGGSNWRVVSGGLETATTTDFARAAIFVATSTTGTSTFAGNVVIQGNLQVQGGIDGAGITALIALIIATIAAGVATYTNKRIQPRVSSSASGNITPTKVDFDRYIRTAQSAAITISNPTMDIGEVVAIQLTDNATARAITFGSDYVGLSGLALPTITTVSKIMTMVLEKVTANKVLVSFVNEA